MNFTQTNGFLPETLSTEKCQTPGNSVQKLFENARSVDDFVQLSSTIPHWLEGSLFQIGPGEWSLEGGLKFQHWFDGVALLQEFKFENGELHYRNKITGNTYKNTVLLQGTHGVILGRMTNTARLGLRDTFKLYKGMIMNMQLGANINVTVNPRYYLPSDKRSRSMTLKTDGPFVQEVDRATLEPLPVLRLEDINKHFSLAVLAPSHDEYDPVRDTTYSFTLRPSLTGTIICQPFAVSEEHPSTQLFDAIKIGQKLPYAHSFATTARYLIVVHSPTSFDLFRLFHFRSVASALAMTRASVKFYVFDKDTRKHVKTIVAVDRPFIMTHHINSFENEDGDIVMDVISNSNWDVLERYYLDSILDSPADGLHISHHLENAYRRVILPMNSGRKEMKKSVKAMVTYKLHTLCLEYPSINPKLTFKSHRYFYAVCNDGPTQSIHGFPRCLLKYDTQNAEVQRFQLRETLAIGGSFNIGEPMFVPLPDGKEEDEGCIIMIGFDVESEVNHVFIVDAQSMTQLADIEMPFAMPFGLHGAFAN